MAFKQGHRHRLLDAVDWRFPTTSAACRDRWHRRCAPAPDGGWRSRRCAGRPRPDKYFAGSPSGHRYPAPARAGATRVRAGLQSHSMRSAASSRAAAVPRAALRTSVRQRWRCLGRQQSMTQHQREAAGELHELSTRGFAAGHEPLFIDGCVPPIDLFANNNNIKCKNTKVECGINTFI